MSKLYVAAKLFGNKLASAKQFKLGLSFQLTEMIMEWLSDKEWARRGNDSSST